MRIHASSKDRHVFHGLSRRSTNKAIFPNVSTITLPLLIHTTFVFQNWVLFISKQESCLMAVSVPLPSGRKHPVNMKHLFFANTRKLIFQRQERQSVLMLVSRILQFFLMEQKSDCLVLTNDQRSNFITGKESHQEDFFQLKR